MRAEETSPSNSESPIIELKQQPLPYPAPGVRSSIQSVKKYALLPFEFFGMLHDQLSLKGYFLFNKYEDWDELSKRLEREVSQFRIQNPNSFEDQDFIHLYEKFTESHFLPVSKIEILSEGPKSFEKRFELIASAQKHIHILTWAFYEDFTGYEIARRLIEKHKAGVDVKIITDGQMAHETGLEGVVDLLEKEGVPVVRWENKRSGPSSLGQHRKIMIFDGQSVIAGGRNFGDMHSHLAEGKAKWRDTDIYFEGDAALEPERLFVNIWNSQTEKEKQISFEDLVKEIHDSETNTEPPLPSIAQVSLINHTPYDDAHILKSILLSIDSARTSIDIENAYFILYPALERAISRAISRGVKVRILTNSAESIDEAIVAYPILKSVNKIFKQGAEVYLKKGDTLHSKFMLVDGQYSWVGSYNFHPRSYRIEGEVIFSILSPAFNQNLKQTFEQDLSESQKVEKEVRLPKSIHKRLGTWFFYDLL